MCRAARAVAFREGAGPVAAKEPAEGLPQPLSPILLVGHPERAAFQRQVGLHDQRRVGQFHGPLSHCQSSAAGVVEEVAALGLGELPRRTTACRGELCCWTRLWDMA